MLIGNCLKRLPGVPGFMHNSPAKLSYVNATSPLWPGDSSRLPLITFSQVEADWFSGVLCIF